MTLCGIRFRGSWHSWHGAPPRPRHHGPARACCGTEALPGPCMDTRLQVLVHCDLLKPAAGPLVRPPPRPRCLLRHAALCQWHALLRPSVPLLYIFPSAPLLRCPYTALLRRPPVALYRCRSAPHCPCPSLPRCPSVLSLCASALSLSATLFLRPSVPLCRCRCPSLSPLSLAAT
jgi:hypothetical protein